MGTRSMIIVKHKDGREMAQYCHWDGYPGGVGKTLLDNYASQEAAEHLSSIGDLSALRAKPDPDKGSPHTFDKAQEGVTIAYGRDRGEKDVEAKDVTIGVVPDMDQEWEYYWNGEQWLWRKCKYGEKITMDARAWAPLTAQMIDKSE